LWRYLTVGIISGMPPEPFVYEARFRGRKTGRMVVILLVFCAIVIVLPAALWARIFVLAACGIGLVILLGAGLSRKAALRMDPSGITLCQSPFFRSAVNFYPWGDVQRIVLWRFERLEHLGVQRREGAPEPKGAFTGPMSQAAAGTTAPGVDPDVAITGVAANTWDLDRQRLVEAVAHFAPTVEVADASTGQLLYPAEPAPPPADLPPAGRQPAAGVAGRLGRTSVTVAQTRRSPSARATAMRWCPSST
jgi:hypothetical protein